MCGGRVCFLVKVLSSENRANLSIAGKRRELRGFAERREKSLLCAAADSRLVFGAASWMQGLQMLMFFVF